MQLNNWKNMIFRFLFLLAISYALVGCASTSKPLELSGLDKSTFFNPPKDKNLVSLYLTCGKDAKDGNYNDELNPECAFTINGKNYSYIQSGQVAKVDVPAGKFTIGIDYSKGNFTDKHYFVPSVKTIEVKPDEKMLLVYDRNIRSVPLYVMFGSFIGVAIWGIMDAIAPPPKLILNPLTIYKNDFMNQISMKTPVKVFVIDSK